MSQHDFDIANQGFAAFRADLNNALKALGSLSSGTEAPTTTYANQLWYETDTNILYIRNEANSAWLNVMVINQTTGSPSFTAGSVGIGTTSPGAMLELATGNAGLGILDATNRLRFTDTDPTLVSGQSTGAIEWYTSDTDAPGVHAYIGTLGANTGAADLIFGTGVGGATAEAMRINASGVGIGTTPNAKLHVVRDLPTANVGTVSLFDRTTSTGEIIRLLKDGATVGSIGHTAASSIYFGSGDTTLTCSAAGDAIVPTGTDGATRSGLIDLGNSANRWDTVFATVGTINTSDRTEKQDIEELNDAERRVAVACKGLLRKYRLKSAVALKGEDARIHFGIIAQDLQAAFEAEGLDAGRYGMFIHSTWTDEETGEEKSLMGVRYSELLAFMIAVL